MKRGVLAILVLFAAAASGLAQDPQPGALVELGAGRVRRAIAMDAREAATVSEAGTVVVPTCDFLQRFLERELPLRFPGVERVSLVGRVTLRVERGQTVAARDRWLEVTGERSAVAAAADFVHRVSELGRGEVVVTVEVYAGPESAPTDGPVVAVLDQTALDATRRELASRAGWTRVAALEARAQCGADATTSRLTEHAFVTDWSVESVGGRTLVVPKIDRVRDGVTIHHATVLLPDGELALACTLDVASLATPVPTERTHVAGREVEIQAPTVFSVRWETDRLVLDAAERGVLVTGLPDPSVAAPIGSDEVAVRGLACLWRVRTAEPPGAAPPAEVVGYDARERVAFVRGRGADFSRDRPVLFQRGGQNVARGRVLEVWDGAFAVQVEEGRVRVGDGAR